MKLTYALLVFLLLGAGPACAADWSVQPDKSTLGFSGTQTGTPFQGHFTKWHAEISFDPAQPQTAHVKVLINLASATTSDTQRDTALPQADWFDVKNFPQASFESSGFVAKGGSAYEAFGKLTIRGVSQTMVLPFTLTITGNQAEAKGHLTLVRTAFGVGQGAWSSGDYVALNVDVNFDLVASRSGG